jgi:hypothetical protein
LILQQFKTALRRRAQTHAAADSGNCLGSALLDIELAMPN